MDTPPRPARARALSKGCFLRVTNYCTYVHAIPRAIRIYSWGTCLVLETHTADTTAVDAVRGVIAPP